MGVSVDDFTGRDGDSKTHGDTATIPGSASLHATPATSERTVNTRADAESMHPDVPVIVGAAPHDPIVARAVAGLAGLPTIVAVGPFDDQAHAEQLAAAFTLVHRRCQVQLVLLGTGLHRVTVMRRALAQGVRTNVHVEKDRTGERWADLIAAADVVVPCVAAGPVTLLDVLAAGRPVVASADPAAVRLIVPSSVGLVYRQGDVTGMARALLRLLVSPALRTRMGCRAREVARRHQWQQTAQQQAGHGK
jgi:glycosyltransferase involved in cell wall biosynthesis